MKTKECVVIIAAAFGLAASWFAIGKQLFSGPGINQALHQGIGEALAEETIRTLRGQGDILVITLAERDSKMTAAQFAAFRARIEKSGVRIEDVEWIRTEKSDKYGPGRGLSAKKLAREVRKNSKKAAIVSFVGLPHLAPEEFASLGDPVPPLVGFSRDAEKLGPLLDRGMLKAVIVPRLKFPAPGPEFPRTPGEWLTNQYEIIRPD